MGEKRFCRTLLKKPPQTQAERTVCIGFAGMTVVFHLCYVLLSAKSEQITVHRKYTMTNYGHTDFMVVDKKGRHLNVNNSFWFWQWSAIESWMEMQENKTYKIQRYGVRIPILGVFPVIVRKKDFLV